MKYGRRAIELLLETLPPEQAGWLAGLRDPFVGKALSLMHGKPAHDWTIEELAKKLANPVAALISVPFQYNHDDGIGASDGSKDYLNVQPVIPFSLNTDWNIITRTIMPLVDLHELRTRLLELSWVKDARVSKQLPDTLVIDIVERTPHAVLRLPDRLVLIDANGNLLEPISPERARGKLILSGANAGTQVAVLSALLGAAPALKPQIREAEWVGNRRWNLTFKTGQVLDLPEGNRPMAKALIEFARLDGTNRLIGGRVAAFDMRTPGRVYLRIPGRSDQAQQATQKSGTAKPGSPKPSESKSGPEKLAELSAPQGEKN